MKTIKQLIKTSLLLSQLCVIHAQANSTDDAELAALDSHYSGKRPIDQVVTTSLQDATSLKDLLKRKSTASLLKDVLQNNLSKTQFERIKIYEESSVMIGSILKERIQSKTQNTIPPQPSDSLVIETLSRTQYIINAIKNILGGNIDMSINWVEQFYQRSYQLALSIANSPYSGMTQGEFGNRYSQLIAFKRFEDISYPAKAKLAIFQLKMIEKDLKADIHSNHQSIQDLLVNIALLREQNESYKQLLIQFQDSQLNPTDYDVVSAELNLITEKLPQALIDAGSALQ